MQVPSSKPDDLHRNNTPERRGQGQIDDNTGHSGHVVASDRRTTAASLDRRELKAAQTERASGGTRSKVAVAVVVAVAVAVTVAAAVAAAVAGRGTHQYDLGYSKHDEHHAEKHVNLVVTLNLHEADPQCNLQPTTASVENVINRLPTAGEHAGPPQQYL